MCNLATENKVWRFSIAKRRFTQVCLSFQFNIAGRTEVTQVSDAPARHGRYGRAEHRIIRLIADPG